MDVERMECYINGNWFRNLDDDNLEYEKDRAKRHGWKIEERRIELLDSQGKIHKVFRLMIERPVGD